MPVFEPPTRDMLFTLRRIGGLDEVAALPGHEEHGEELVAAVLEEAGRLAREVLAPLNPSGDRQGARMAADGVAMPDGFAAAYRRFAEGGWMSLPFDPGHGGQGLPWLVSTAVSELWHAANMSFALVPMLTQPAIELIARYGSAEQQARYLPQLIAGTWTATMEMTEPQAGSDLGLIRARAEPAADGTWRLKGQKIFITNGDHDLTENILHVVLARTPDAPEGTRGLSLFLAPKILPDGRRNDLHAVRLEEKLGIHASPTCVMAYGDGDGCVAEMVGERHRGLAHMFTMMNHARLSVGLQGVAVAERARQRALAYARERRQGRGAEGHGPVPIVEHADVRRMLATQTALTEAARGLVYHTAALLDRADRHPDATARAEAARDLALLTPVAKAWASEAGIAVADLGVQVHGGMGFIEETGAAQHLRDARITAIYEGTNGIQAHDLVARKVLADDGAGAAALAARLRDTAAAVEASPPLTALAAPFARAVAALEDATAWLLATGAGEDAGAAAMSYLRLMGLTAGAWCLLREALADDAPAGKAETAGFYVRHLLPRAAALAETVTAGASHLATAAPGAP